MVCDDKIKSVNISPVPFIPANPQVFTPSDQQVSLAIAQQVQCDTSPFFFAFYKHHTYKIVIDSGATSSLVSKSFIKAAGISELPTLHVVRQLDKSKLKLSDEVKLTLDFGDTELPIDGLVNDKFCCDTLAVATFCKANNIELHLKEEEITINGKRIPYGSKPDSIQYDIYLMECCTLRNDVSRVLLPGEFLEVYDNKLLNYEGKIALEPRLGSSLNGECPVYHGLFKEPYAYLNLRMSQCNYPGRNILYRYGESSDPFRQQYLLSPCLS